MKIELVTSTENAELLIERAMRICHGGDVDPEKGANKTFIQNIIKLGHESPLEHGVMTFKITDENNNQKLVTGSQWMNGFVKIEKVKN